MKGRMGFDAARGEWVRVSPIKPRQAFENEALVMPGILTVLLNPKRDRYDEKEARSETSKLIFRQHIQEDFDRVKEERAFCSLCWNPSILFRQGLHLITGAAGYIGSNPSHLFPPGRLIRRA